MGLRVELTARGSAVGIRVTFHSLLEMEAVSSQLAFLGLPQPPTGPEVPPTGPEVVKSPHVMDTRAMRLLPRGGIPPGEESGLSIDS